MYKRACQVFCLLLLFFALFPAAQALAVSLAPEQIEGPDNVLNVGERVKFVLRDCPAETKRGKIYWYVGLGEPISAGNMESNTKGADGSFEYITSFSNAQSWYLDAECFDVNNNVIASIPKSARTEVVVAAANQSSLNIGQPTAEEDGDGKMEMGEEITIPASGCVAGGTIRFKYYYATDAVSANALAVNVDVGANDQGAGELKARFNPYTSADPLNHPTPYAVYLEAKCIQNGSEVGSTGPIMLVLQANDNPAATNGMYYPTEKPPPPPACANDSVADGKCTSVDTAVGKLSTEANTFIEAVFALLLSLSGGVCVLINIYAGYLYMVSRGNPEQLQRAREMIISAIVGLLFIVFSFVLMETITGDILRLPGFVFQQEPDPCNQIPKGPC